MVEIDLVKLQAQKTSAGYSYKLTVPIEIIVDEKWEKQDKIRFVKDENTGRIYLRNISVERRSSTA